MIFKDERMREEFWRLDPKLQLICVDVVHWGIVKGEEPTFTSFLRTEDEQKKLFELGQSKSKISVHLFGRGADFRVFKNSVLNFLVSEYINEKYPYDPKRPRLKTLLTHEGSALHHHLQVMET